MLDRLPIRILPLFLICAAAGPIRAAAPPPAPVQQLTTGPLNHFFGYIGQCRTIPWSGDGRQILALQTSFQDRMPGPADAAEIVLIDTAHANAPRVVERTRAWNPQQGTMLYWNPQAPATQFFFNDRDPQTGKVFAVLYDIAMGKRLREYRFQDTPVGNGGVAQAGGWFLAINYARLARLRPVTGYPGAFDWTAGVAAPENDGIFKVDVATGEKKLIVSFAQLREQLRGVDPKIDARHLFINHTLCNRDGDLIYFYCRADFENNPNPLNEAFTVRPDGSGLTRQAVHVGGHPEWAEGSRIIGSKDGQQVIMDTATQKVVQSLGGKEVFAKPEGDVALSPDGRWLVNGHGAKGYNRYTFLERATGRVVKSAPVPQGTWKASELRLDPAPCWNRAGDAIVVPGCAPDGTRQMFVIRIGQPPKNSPLVP